MILPDGEKNAILKFHKSEKCRFNFREKFSNAIVEGGKNYRLDELGLSEKAIRNLVLGRVNRKCINHLLEDEELLRLMNNSKPVNKISDNRSEEL